MYVEYRATTLAELIEVCQAIHNEAIAQAKGPVDPAEIVLNGPVCKGVDFTLTDGYDCPSGYGIDGTDAIGFDGNAELVDGEVCNACGKSLDLSPANGFDYKHQAWVVNGRYVALCGHLQMTPCDCYGRTHEGESPAPDADIH